MWNFKGTLWNSTQNILPIHWKIQFLYNIEILRALRFKSSYAVLKRPPDWGETLGLGALGRWVGGTGPGQVRKCVGVGALGLINPMMILWLWWTGYIWFRGWFVAQQVSKREETGNSATLDFMSYICILIDISFKLVFNGSIDKSVLVQGMVCCPAGVKKRGNRKQCNSRFYVKENYVSCRILMHWCLLTP